MQPHGTASDELSFLDRCSSLWIPVALGITLLAGAVFNCPPAIFFSPEVELEPAYQAKSVDPLADTALIPREAYGNFDGSYSHGTKLTPRIFPSILLWMSLDAGGHPYLPATLGGVLLLISVLIVVRSLTADRSTAFAAALTIAGMYAGTSCFSVTGAAKPFDGVALGLSGLVLLSARLAAPFAGIVAWLGLWTDERVVVVIFILFCWTWIDPRYSGKQGPGLRIALPSAIALYAISRMLLASVADWSKPDLSDVGFGVVASTAPLVGLLVWSCLKGGLIPLIHLLMKLHSQNRRAIAAGYLGVIAVALASCLVVLDLSRAGSYLCVLVPLTIGALRHAGTGRLELRITTWVGAIVSLLAPNFEVIARIAITWLPTGAAIFLRWILS